MLRRVLSAMLLLTLNTSLRAEPLTMTARSRVPNPVDMGGSSVREQLIHWEPSKTAIIICDMWDKHWCAGATQRVGALAPRMNEIVDKARQRGVFVIHSPSDCMDFYKDMPQRKLAQVAPAAKNPPNEIANWCRQLPGEPPMPVDDSDGGCDDVPVARNYRAWTRQHAAINVHENDAVSDKGQEIWNLLEARGITNVMIMGVHTNMCVLGRPFGLRQMARNGKNVVLVRDLTDAMYNPKKAPFVSHRRGTELIIEHIEKHVCASITAMDIIGDPNPGHVVFVVGEDEYRTEVSLPRFAKEELEKRHFRCTFVNADAKEPSRFPGLAAILDADLVVLSVRRRVPPNEELSIIRKYLDSGRPLVGIRTASHAFALRDKPDGWPTFDREVLGGDYQGHYGAGKDTMLTPIPSAAKHPILTGIPSEFSSKETLYKNKGLAKSATPLLRGRIGPAGQEDEFVAWTNSYKGGRVFYVSLGGVDDFANASFKRLLVNGIFWAMERQVPAK